MVLDNLYDILQSRSHKIDQTHLQQYIIQHAKQIDDLQSLLEQVMSSSQFTGVGREGDPQMSQDILEIKISVATIETRLASLEKSAVDITRKLDTIPTKDFLENLILKSDKERDRQISELQKDFVVIKTRSDDAITNKKWFVTTVIATIAAVAGIIKLFL